jgi:hypothetical protein
MLAGIIMIHFFSKFHYTILHDYLIIGKCIYSADIEVKRPKYFEFMAFYCNALINNIGIFRSLYILAMPKNLKIKVLQDAMFPEVAQVFLTKAGVGWPVVHEWTNVRLP